MTRDDIAFMVHEIISEAHTRKKGASMQDLTEKYVKKFVSNSPAVVPKTELEPLDEKELKILKDRIINNNLSRPYQWLFDDLIKEICQRFGTSAVGTGKQGNGYKAVTCKCSDWQYKEAWKIEDGLYGCPNCKGIVILASSSKLMHSPARSEVDVIKKLVKFAKSQENCPKEIIALVDKHFWELI